MAANDPNLYRQMVALEAAFFSSPSESITTKKSRATKESFGSSQYYKLGSDCPAYIPAIGMRA